MYTCLRAGYVDVELQAHVFARRTACAMNCIAVSVSAHTITHLIACAYRTRMLG